VNTHTEKGKNTTMFKRILVICGLALLMAACDTVTDCTEATCQSEFTVELTGDITPERYTVEVQGGNQILRATCEDGEIVGEVEAVSIPVATARCDADSLTFFVEEGELFNPPEVEVSVQYNVSATEAGEAQATLSPDYTINRPNGPGCDPTCASTTVTLSLP
jgi:hypothetical protein